MVEVKEEYAEKPVPQNARLGFLKPAMVWAGFAHAYICIFIGSQIMGGLGAPIGYAAIISGQIFLFVYSGLIAHRGAKLGLNFSMMCKAAFGKYGYIVPVLLISGLVAGWFIFQGWLAADLTVGLYGGKSFNAGVGNGVLPGILGTTSFWAGIWCVAFGFLAVSGMRAMAWFGKFAVFTVAALEVWMIYSILTVVASHTGGNPLVSPIVGKPWTFALGFTASVGTFIVSSTMTGDFVRWTKNAKQAWAVTGIAFPVCNLVTLMIGAIYTAVAGKLDFFFGLSAVALGLPIMIMQLASNGSVCDGCLYNAGQGFKNITYYISKGRINYSWKKVTMIVMFAGAAVAVSNLITNIVPWLLTIGTLVPLVGGVLIGHFWIVARKNTLDEHLVAADRKVNTPALIGLGVGLVIAVVIQFTAPDLPAVIGGLIGGIGVYPIVAKTTGYFMNGRLTAKGLGGSISYGTAGAMDNTDTPTSPDAGAPSAQTKDTYNKNTSSSGNSLGSGGTDQISAKIDKLVGFLAPWFGSSSRTGGS
jgi:cytosine permease